MPMKIHSRQCHLTCIHIASKLTSSQLSRVTRVRNHLCVSCQTQINLVYVYNQEITHLQVIIIEYNETPVHRSYGIWLEGIFVFHSYDPDNEPVLSSKLQTQCQGNNPQMSVMQEIFYSCSRRAWMRSWTRLSFSSLVDLRVLYFKDSAFHSSLLFLGASDSAFLKGSSRIAL